MTKILFIDGSLGGKNGNTAQALKVLQKAISTNDSTAEFKSVFLADEKEDSLSASNLEEVLSWADALVFSSGTYWDSWGSPLQKFFEAVTPLEGHGCWAGKPAALVTTMHSVGGKEILNRLHGVLNSLGLFVPPMCGFTYSFSNQAALSHPDKTGLAEDLWRLSDLEIVASNLLLATRHKVQFATWPIDRGDAKRLWLKSISS